MGALTIHETPTFVAEAAKIWSTEERLQFFASIAREPGAGVVIPGSGGCRKLRWSRPGMGKQGGARVIYFTHLEAGELCMLLVYPKAAKDNIPGYILKESARRLKMTARKTKAVGSTGEELGLKLLQSVREMKARKFARVTEVEVNEVVQARQSTGLSQAEFANALSI